MNPFKIIFMGTSDFAVPALRALAGASYPILSVVTQPDRPAGRGLELKASPVKQAALELALPLFQPEKIKAPESIEFLKKLKPDVMVVAAYGQILPKAVLEIPRAACLNIHGSLLPRWRGAAPIHYSLMNGDLETGVTLMYMNEKMDEGDVLLTEKTPVGVAETTGELHDRLALLGAGGVVKALELLRDGKAGRTPQDGSIATYAPSLKREQCKIRWDRKAEEVVNQIRGLSPWPCAETQWNEKQLRVFSAQRIVGDGGTAGQVLSIEKEGITVAALSGRVLMKEVQPPGKRRMGAYDFTLGHPDFKIGEQLK